ncbi:hypothetical protein CPB85DRAFT_1435138 [Mucidula mucida]|nr:hypothetical protein CPB85DRAFT_1435138 [Mucidula mucida]
MTAGSPAAYLLWAILACTFQIFMTLHLWAYDRFKCLKWSSGRQPGAFKRVMTYSYVATVPLLVVFSVAMTSSLTRQCIRIRRLDGNQIVPRPLEQWTPATMRWVLPLFFMLSIAWAFELVTHLEEFTFWLFLLHQGPSKRLWFSSWEFRLWYLGSMVAVIGMPLVTLIKRVDLSSVLPTMDISVRVVSRAATTVGFLYVIARFPSFIRRVKAEGAKPDVVVRLSTFYTLNVIRIAFRFFFNVPLLVLGIDGIEPPYPVLKQPFWADALLMIGGIGCFVSSALTLLLFFPRSLSRESGYTVRKISPPPFAHLNRPASSSLPRYHLRDPSPKFPAAFDEPVPPNLHPFHFSAGSHNSVACQDCQDLPPHRHQRELSDDELTAPDDLADSQDRLESQMPRHVGSDDMMRESHRNGKSAAVNAPLDSPFREEMPSTGLPPAIVHPYVMSFTSPIDLWDEDDLPRSI